MLIWFELNDVSNVLSAKAQAHEKVTAGEGMKKAPNESKLGGTATAKLANSPNLGILEGWRREGICLSWKWSFCCRHGGKRIEIGLLAKFNYFGLCRSCDFFLLPPNPREGFGNDYGLYIAWNIECHDAEAEARYPSSWTDPSYLRFQTEGFFSLLEVNQASTKLRALKKWYENGRIPHTAKKEERKEGRKTGVRINFSHHLIVERRKWSEEHGVISARHAWEQRGKGVVSYTGERGDGGRKWREEANLKAFLLFALDMEHVEDTIQNERELKWRRIRWDDIKWITGL